MILRRLGAAAPAIFASSATRNFDPIWPITNYVTVAERRFWVDTLEVLDRLVVDDIQIARA